MSAAVSALAFLWYRSTLNYLLARLKRLRQVRYLLGAAVGIGYLFLIFGGTFRNGGEASPAVQPGLLLNGFALLMLFSLFIVWLWPRGRSSHHYNEADIAFLFPGPISDRLLHHYSLLKGLAALLISSLIFAVISYRSGQSPGTFWHRLLAIQLLMSTYTLHIIALGFTFTRLLDRGVRQWQRQLALGCGIVLLLWLVLRDFTAPLAADTYGMSGLLEYINRESEGTLLYRLLLPFRLLILPFVDPAWRNFLPAAAICALHYWWALNMSFTNSDGSIARSEKQAEVMAAIRSGNIWNAGRKNLAPNKAPFTLKPGTRGEFALLWKNLLATRGYLRLRTFVILALLLIAFDFWIDANRRFVLASVIVTMIAAIAAVNCLMMGAMFARQDLRSDQNRFDMLKTYPLEGWQVVLGSMLSPVLILSAIYWLCILHFSLVTLEPGQAPWWTPQLRVVTGVAAALAIPFVTALQILMMNAFTLLFPAWSQNVSAHHQQGLDVAGQRILFFIGQWLLILITLIPAFLVGFIAWIPLQWLLGGLYAVIPATMIGTLVLAAALAWGINFLGNRFEGFDLTE